MSSSSYLAGRDAPNPLRPYYISPSIGQPSDSNFYQNTSPPHASPSSNARNAFQTPAKQSFSSARDMFYDLDCSDYLSDASPSAADMVRALLDQALWKYTSVLLAQPFDVAKTVLQCQVISVGNGAIAGSHGGRGHRGLYTDDRVYVRLRDSWAVHWKLFQTIYMCSYYHRQTRTNPIPTNHPPTSHPPSPPHQAAPHHHDQPTNVTRPHEQHPPPPPRVLPQVPKK